MSTSLLYHGFGIVGYHYVRTEFKGGEVIFTIKQEDTALRCPLCGSREVIKKGSIVRKIKLVPIGKKRVYVQLPVHRVYCKECGITRQVTLKFADERRRYSRSFARYALELSRHMTIRDVAEHLQVSWDTVKDIVKRFLHARFSRVRLKDLKQIAIDEISIGRGHKYFSTVLDLKSGAIVYVGEGKGSEALDAFWARLKRSGAQIEAVAIDMSVAYIKAVKENLPGAVLVFDHFHIIKMYNDRLSEFRRSLYHRTKDKEKQKVLKGSRWLLLKSPENLDVSGNEVYRLEKALALNQPLAMAYYMKEDLRRLWTFSDKERATVFLEDWIRRAEASKVRMLMGFAKTLRAHKEGILAYYDYPISTGPLEGINNKIKTMKRQAYGFRDMEFFKLKIRGCSKFCVRSCELI